MTSRSNKKYTARTYKLEVISESGNPFHGLMKDKPAIPVSFEVGKRGWFIYEVEEDLWDRVKTSKVQDVSHIYSAGYENITVITQNSTYSFTYEETEE